jgi:hypothetical protein
MPSAESSGGMVGKEPRGCPRMEAPVEFTLNPNVSLSLSLAGYVF